MDVMGVAQKEIQIMGCDIHVHTEVKINGQMEHYGSPDVNRNYWLFEKMAGVRGEEKNAICPPKGLPSKMSVITQLAATVEQGDAHTHSWFGRPEIIQLYTWWEKEYRKQYPQGHPIPEYQFGFLFGNGWDENPLYEEGIIEDVRWIFWFDN